MRTPCPACRRDIPQGEASCPYCHVVIAKFKPSGETADVARDLQSVLKASNALVVRQEVEMMEALIGVERKNRFTVMNGDGYNLYFATEESGFLARQILGSYRPFVITVAQPGSDLTVFTISKPFRLYHDVMEVRDGASRLVGSIESGFPIPLRWYTLRDARGNTLFRISGAFWRPWTFKLFRNEIQVGEIRKKWGGLVKEYFTDADTFGIRFPEDVPVSHKALLMGALFLIDIVQFENNQ